VRRIWIWAAVAAAAAGCNGIATDGSRATQDVARETAVVGCVVPAREADAAVGTSGRSTGPAALRDRFVLTATTSTARPYGTAGTSASTERTFALVGDDDELRRYLGARVEIRGVVVRPFNDPNAPQLRVASIRQLVSTCGGVQS
jgi:hypothetical protein